jgi:hypothetical protein
MHLPRSLDATTPAIQFGLVGSHGPAEFNLFSILDLPQSSLDF